MDITTLIGFAAMAGMVALGVRSGELPAFFLNWHGLGIVLGGTLAAMLVNTPFQFAREALAGLVVLLRGSPYSSKDAIVREIMTLAESVHARGLTAMRDVDPRAVGGYLAQASEVALEQRNPETVWQILETGINADYDHNNEVANIYRTMAVLAPMFGLLGTLIGIVTVLREIANPERVSHAMSVAMTTAFYGIALANVFCVPVAGKLRARNIQELRARGMVADAVLMMLRGSVPSIIERKLRSYR